MARLDEARIVEIVAQLAVVKIPRLQLPAELPKTVADSIHLQRHFMAAAVIEAAGNSADDS
jgi:hypothetical protein